MHPVVNLALLIGAACGLPAACVWAGPSQTGIVGVVTQSPVRPGPQRIGEPGAGPFAGALVEVRNPRGAVVARATADDAGHFRVIASPGYYEVRAHAGAAALPRCEAAGVLVQQGKMAEVDIACDSGLR